MNERSASAVVLALLTGVSASACSKALPADEPRAVTAPASATSAGQPELTLQTQTTPAPLGLAFGAPCKAEDAVHCGTKGRVAVMVAMRNGMPSKRTDVPCPMERLGESPFEPIVGCVQDDRVYLTAGCLECRVFSEWDMTGIVAEMTDSQLVSAQKRIGLTAAPILRTPESWRTAMATSAARARRKR